MPILYSRRYLIVLLFLSGSILILLHISGSRRKTGHGLLHHLPWTADSHYRFQIDPYVTLASTSPSISVTETSLLLRPSGFTVYDRLYVRNGTIYAVTDDPGMYPDLKHIIAKGISTDWGLNVDPTDEEMRIVSLEVAKRVLGDEALVIDGMTFILYDSTQFMAHYYHWWGEIILGALRVYKGLSLLPQVKKPLQRPSRFILPNIHDQEWRDYSGVDGPFMRAAFPSAAIELADYWEDLATLDRTFVFERAMIISREAAHKHPLASVLFKMIASTMTVSAPAHFFEHTRQTLVRNLVNYLPILNSAGAVVSPPRTEVPQVLYVSRQSGGRRLRVGDHVELVEALREMCKGEDGKKICDFAEVRMEEWGYADQVEVVARSTIMIGVHGNGLTHQLWMPPSHRSTVIEIFYPKTYIHDYEILSRNMGHKHYAVWNDTTITYPNPQGEEYFHGVQHGQREDFHGNNIPVRGPTVAKLVRKRLVDEIP